ncbi:MAG: 23S rRNA (uracil(1939)-C(5))-methyltransferase RlmD [Clostridia bacterium]|nr:23S rRNA (uracil(1939)-C(5))-methyltransferase RlmD [Clostridia bacterium]
MWEKNEELVGTVVSYGSEGEGVIKTEDGTVFVPFCLVGETVKVRLLKVKDKIAYGKLVQVLVSSPDRVSPVCPVYDKCGGCSIQHMRYSAQLKYKQNQVRDTLKKLGNLDADVEETIPCALPFGYRNKLQLPVGYVDGKTVVGFYAERSHRIVPITDCPVTPWAKDAVDAVMEYSKRCSVRGYDEATGEGTLRHLVVREIAGKFIVTVVTATKRLPRVDELLSVLKEKFTCFTLWQNVNETKSNVIFGKEFHLLYGDGTFSDVESGISYSAGAQTFVQVNRDIREKLYHAVLAEVDADTDVIDCYAGGGLLTAMLAKKCRSAHGIEIVAEAVDCANVLKRENGLANMTNHCGAVEDILPDLMKRLGDNVCLTVDPPRKGLERSVVHTIMESGVERIVMISCNPATLARDLGLLCGTLKEENGKLVKGDGNGNYTPVFIRPYDMFPQTKHVETLVALQRNDKA